MSAKNVKESYEIYAKYTFMLVFTKITGLHYQLESFENYEQAEQWLRENGKKKKEYTIIKTYKILD